MANDIGQVTNDATDVAPANPIDALDNLPATSTRRKKPKSLKRLSDFNPELGATQDAKALRDSWWGIIIDADTFTTINNKQYYEVQLQTGDIVNAYYPDQTVEQHWVDNQKVHVIFDGVDYTILTTPDKKKLGLWWEAIQTLLPGGTANGKIRAYDEDNDVFKDYGSEISITDTEKRNFVLRGERVQIQLNEVTYEIIGSFGLKRKAKTTTTITPNNKGDVKVYSKDVVAQEPKPHPNEHIDQDVEVEAWLNWAHSNRSILSGKQLFIEYFNDEEKFVIVGGEC